PPTTGTQLGTSMDSPFSTSMAAFSPPTMPESMPLMNPIRELTAPLTVLTIPFQMDVTPDASPLQKLFHAAPSELFKALNVSEIVAQKVLHSVVTSCHQFRALVATRLQNSFHAATKLSHAPENQSQMASQLSTMTAMSAANNATMAAMSTTGQPPMAA